MGNKLKLSAKLKSSNKSKNVSKEVLPKCDIASKPLVLSEPAKIYTTPNSKIGRLLKKIQFAHLMKCEREKLCGTLVEFNYLARTMIFEEGNISNVFYNIKQGTVSVVKIDPVTKKQSFLKKLSESYHFGERTLSVLADTFLILWTLDKSLFKILFNKNRIKLNSKMFIQLLDPLGDMLKKTEKYKTLIEVTKWKPAGIPFHELIIVGVLGRGNYGYVQLVKDKKNKTYALKSISKQRIVENHQKQHTLNEKIYMQQLNHPFLTKLYATYKTKHRVHFLLEPSLGGNLFKILKKIQRMTPRQAKFYSAQVILAFQYMHSKDFLYRDLKPENLLLDKKGYIKIADFGFLKKVAHKTYSFCGTPEYMAPEMIQNLGYGKGIDWWTLGIFIFEELTGYTPFFCGFSSDIGIFDRIVSGHYNFPSYVGIDARSLVSSLLQTKPLRRLGCLKGGVDDIMNDKWYDGFDWKGLELKTLEAPLKVTVQNDFDVSNFNQQVKEQHIKPYIPDGTHWDDEF